MMIAAIGARRPIHRTASWHGNTVAHLGSRPCSVLSRPDDGVFSVVHLYHQTAVRRGTSPSSRVGVSCREPSITSKNRSLRSSSSRHPRKCFVSTARHATSGANLVRHSHSMIQCSIICQLTCSFYSVVACICPFITISCINWCSEKTTQNRPSVEAL